MSHRSEDLKNAKIIFRYRLEGKILILRNWTFLNLNF